MLKLLLVSFVFVLSAYASDKVEIYASSLESQENIVKASGDVIVVYKDYYLSANRATYDRLTGELELFDNIRATQGDDYKLLGDYAKLNIAKKERTFEPFFMLEKNSKVWLSAGKGEAKDKDLEITAGMTSGCNPNNPLWKIEFSSSNYNAEDKWLNLYNARLYIYDIPVFYTPYFGYSLDTKRRTGLLTPSLGLSDSEGLYYEQPIYIAEQNWWDLELKPQVRTSRGYGLYSTFRFIDSKVSKGELKMGYFNENEDYFKSENLLNDYHYGYNFNYNNTDPINEWFDLDWSGQSGLYADINHMNDVDYINLATNDTTQNATATQILSRVNLFYNTDKHYFGTYFKYYKDLTEVSNKKTLQKLPTFQYHYYLDTLLENHLFYNLDIQSNNILRHEGKRVIQTDLNIPITLQTSLFDEYVDVSYTAYLYAQQSTFNGDADAIIVNPQYDDGYFARNYNILAASTQLTRAYSDLTHVIGLGAKYTYGGSNIYSGFYEDNREFCSNPDNLNEPMCEFFNIRDIDEALQLDFTQHVFDESGTQRIYHRLSQNISYSADKDKVGELENEFEYRVSSEIDFYNNMFYNYDKGSFSKLFNKVSYTGYGFNIALSHLYKDTFIDQTTLSDPLRYTSFMTSSARYTYDEHYSYHMRYDYDLKTNLKKSAEIGFLYKKRCWNFGLRYVENNRPILTQQDASSVYDRYIYFTIVLKPMMSDSSSSDFSLKLPEMLKGPL